MTNDNGAALGGNGPALMFNSPSTKSSSSVSTIIDYLDEFARRVIIDALNEATAAYWERRAQKFEDARWRPGDFTGNATIAELDACDRRLRETARACRSRAQLALDAGVGELDG